MRTPTTLLTLSLLSLLAACSSKDRGGGSSTPPEPEKFTVGPTGTTFTSNSNVTLTIPANSVTQDTEISIVKSSKPAGNNTVRAAGSVWKFTPEGMQFNPPITLTLPYNNSTGQALLFYYSSPTNTNVLAPLAGATIDNGTATAQVSHFSYGLVGYEVTEEPDAGTGHEDASEENPDIGPQPDGSIIVSDGGYIDSGMPHPDASTNPDVGSNPCASCIEYSGEDCFICCSKFAEMEYCNYEMCTSEFCN